ncbi:hypothetical protein L484_003434 [Morus notabilis]|uniref:Putative plant transposon protein domain-containing protein n=1 Tax=Morus notabilis TaxID=981085 RepID=W9SEU9_9ROSA|nr:hypothetical protein L484_003434 [Morus notabilis]
MPRKALANRIMFGASSSNRPPAPCPVEPLAPAMPPPDYGISRFVSKDVKKQYERHNKSRACIRERGFDTRNGELPPDIMNVIRDRGWEKFCSEPAAGSTTLVREFFANARKCTKNKTKVGGRVIKFDAETINNHFGIPATSSYQQQDFPDRDPQEILEALCDGRARWTIKQNTDSAFEARYLANYTKVWFHFVCTMLIPLTHISVVTKDRALVLLAIKRGEPLNVGAIINSGVHHALRKNIIGLPYPSLLTELFLAAGVAMPDAHLEKPIQAFDLNSIIRIASGRTASEQDGGAGSLQPPQPKWKRAATTSREDFASRVDRYEEQIADLQSQSALTRKLIIELVEHHTACLTSLEQELTQT